MYIVFYESEVIRSDEGTFKIILSLSNLRENLLHMYNFILKATFLYGTLTVIYTVFVSRHVN